MVRSAIVSIAWLNLKKIAAGVTKMMTNVVRLGLNHPIWQMTMFRATKVMIKAGKAYQSNCRFSADSSVVAGVPLRRRNLMAATTMDIQTMDIHKIKSGADLRFPDSIRLVKHPTVLGRNSAQMRGRRSRAADLRWRSPS